MIRGKGEPSLLTIDVEQGGTMSLSPHKVPRLGRSIAWALAFATIAIPFAQASDSAGKYGPLDPWAYKLVHSAAPTLITEHSAGQDPNRGPSQGRYGPLDPWAYKLVHSAAPTLITEHSAGQDPNRGPSQGRYGPLDPWAYKLVHSAAPTLITEHSAGQDPNRRPVMAVSNAPATIRATGFNWGDAGIVAGGTVGLLLLAAGAINTVRRRRRGVAAVGT
jgi:hypothetical protein